MIEETKLDMTGWPEELAEDRKIDLTQLDLCATEQADLFCKWAERSAVAHSDLDDLEFQADTVEQNLQMKVRTTPENYNITNPTEARFKCAVQCHSKYLDQ